MSELIIGLLALLFLFLSIVIHLSLKSFIEVFDDTIRRNSHSFDQMSHALARMEASISYWDPTFKNLETELKLRKFDSSRLIEWLDKRDRELAQLQVEFIRGQKITDREKKITELSEKLNLIKG